MSSRCLQTHQADVAPLSTGHVDCPRREKGRGRRRDRPCSDAGRPGGRPARNRARPPASRPLSPSAASSRQVLTSASAFARRSRGALARRASSQGAASVCGRKEAPAATAASTRACRRFAERARPRGAREGRRSRAARQDARQRTPPQRSASPPRPADRSVSSAAALRQQPQTFQRGNDARSTRSTSTSAGPTRVRQRSGGPAPTTTASQSAPPLPPVPGSQNSRRVSKAPIGRDRAGKNVPLCPLAA